AARAVAPLPRPRRGASRGQGVRGAGRRYHQLPARHLVSISRILVLEAQAPFVHGGAEILVRQLTGALRDRGYDADIVLIPFRDYPRDELFAGAAAWRQVDVTRAGARPVDLVIATKFPNYFARHPRKVLWLTHQHRAA